MIEAGQGKNGHEREGDAHHRLASLKAQPGSHHHFSFTETVKLATFINARFADESLLASLLPLDGRNPDTFFEAWRDGLLLIVLVDAARKGVVNLGFLRRRARKPLGVTSRHLTIQHFAVLNDALEGCKRIEGLRLGFVGAEDFVQGNRPVILGVGWQLVRIAILRTANVIESPALTELLTAEEAEQKRGHPGQEELVMSRWFNEYLKTVGSDREVWSFGAELADGVAWCFLLNAIDPAACPLPDEFDPEGNARRAINAVQRMGVKGVFLTDEDLLTSDRKLNMMLCAQIMDAFPGLPSRLQRDPDKRDCYRGEDSNKRGTDCTTSSQHSKGSSTAASSMFPSPPAKQQRDVPCSSAPPRAPFVDPSPPRSSWGFGGSGRIFREAGKGEEREHEMVLLESEEEVESKQACGLGSFFGFFGCLSRN